MFDKRWIQRLPFPILQHILSYTYQPQSRALLQDIEHYSTSKQEVHQLYFEMYMTMLVDEVTMYDTSGYEYWCMNDLVHYLNRGMPTMYGYSDDLLRIYQRHVLLHMDPDNATRLHLFVDKMRSGEEMMKEWNLLWGYMTVAERDGFVQYANNKYTYYVEEDRIDF